MWLALGLLVILQLAFSYLPLMHTLFGTVAIGADDRARILVFGLALFLVVECEKMVCAGGFFVRGAPGGLLEATSMAYRLERREEIGQGLQRLVRKRLDAAGVALGEVTASELAGIHSARKRFKEIRAALRLCSSVLGSRQLKAENRLYRDLARRLSRNRDAQALVEVWDDCFDDLEPAVQSKPLVGELAAKLCRRRDAIAAGDAGAVAGAAAVLNQLQDAYARVDEWPRPAGGFILIEPGLRNTYGQGRAGMRTASRIDTDAAIHEWRKRVKDLWYQSQLLEQIWPPEMRMRARALKKLSDLLGTDHDLAALRETLVAEPDLLPDPEARAALSQALGSRQALIRHRAYTQGALLYAEKPKAYSGRIRQYWSVWRGPS